MAKTNFLNKVVPQVNEGYFESPTGRAKVDALHDTMGHLILSNLGSEYQAIGYGFGDGNEFTVRLDNESWKADTFIYNTLNGIDSKGLVIDFKAPMGNFLQNRNNFLNGQKGIASSVRPYGYVYSSFILLPRLIPYFRNDDTFTGRIEDCANGTIEKLYGFMHREREMDNSFDLLGICVYELPELDFSNIFNKDDYKTALLNYNGPIRYYKTNVKSDEKFIINDPYLYAKKAAELVKANFGPKSADQRLNDLFNKLSKEEKIQILVEKNLLSRGV